MKRITIFVLSLVLTLGIFSGLFGQTLIYTQDFTETFPPDGWTIYKSGYGNNWTLKSGSSYAQSGNYCMVYEYSSHNANAWAFMQGIPMTAGNIYSVEFYQKVFSAQNAENMKVTVGTAQDEAAQTITLLDLPGVTNTDYTNRVTADFIPTTSGTYYFAFNCYSDAGRWTLYVDNIRVYETAGPDEPVPVELSSFTAAVSADNIVNLMWVTQSETGVLGFYVLRNTENHLGSALTVSELIPATNTSEQQSYIFKDSEIHEDGLYYYWLQNSDFNGATQIHGPVSIQFTTNENSTPEIPLVTQLNPVYPNPFNPMAFIPFSLKEAATVNFEIYNARGQLMKRIPLGQKAAGNHRIEWDGNDDQGHPCGTGIYQIRMTAGSESFSRKAVLMK